MVLARLVALWIVIGVVVFTGVRWIEGRQRQQQTLTLDGGAVELKRQRDGHFHWPGRVNGVAVEFLVDTGATTTALPAALAAEAGIAVSEMPGQWSSTAGGRVRARQGQADIALDGGLRAKQLRVAVLPALEAPLLGMDVLGRLEFRQRGGVLRIEVPGR